jgi:hypothetical protein
MRSEAKTSALRQADESLRASDPHLAGMFDTFCATYAREQMPGHEVRGRSKPLIRRPSFWLTALATIILAGGGSAAGAIFARPSCAPAAGQHLCVPSVPHER